jgi:LDH2 family malate/lactate/ureidoglycolate dehydrogenase
MNTTVEVTASQAHRACCEALVRAGLTALDAATVTDALLDAELTGRSGHGFIRVPAIVKRARQDGVGSDRIRVTKDLENTVAVDGGGALGFLAATRCAELARERLSAQPLVAVACRGTSHVGALGYYARLVAEAGPYWALAMANCCPLMAPHGVPKKMLGTNPIALACADTPHPLVVDVSPAATTYGDVMRAKQSGQALAEGVAIDAAGAPTTDPEAAGDGALLPIAGAKGSAIGFMVQLMAGPLCGAAAIPDPGTDYGFLLISGRLDAFGEEERVKQNIQDLVAAIREAGGRCPGDGSADRRAQALDQGLEMPRTVWDALCALRDET